MAASSRRRGVGWRQRRLSESHQTLSPELVLAGPNLIGVALEFVRFMVVCSITTLCVVESLPSHRVSARPNRLLLCDSHNDELTNEGWE